MTNKKTSKASTSNRPTSPHIQIYRWNISSFTSILHRLTGAALYFSVLILSWYIVFYTYQTVIAPAESESCDCPINQLIDYAFIVAGIFITFALYYHLCNGVRHLFWDIGKGFEKETSATNGYLVIITSIIITAITIGAVVYFKIS
ncbi:MAG: succinate dehydrogenase, cytochrome b556 subunit [Proteobacteria bacterium]|nr:succinate dehydrogenase, cytochrome b556 subunit [Pseudomonadota bacterium]